MYWSSAQAVFLFVFVGFSALGPGPLGDQLCRDVAKTKWCRNCCLTNQYGSTLDVSCVSVNACLHCIFMVSGFSLSIFFSISLVRITRKAIRWPRRRKHRVLFSPFFAVRSIHLSLGYSFLLYFARSFIALRPNFLNSYKRKNLWRNVDSHLSVHK